MKTRKRLSTTISGQLAVCLLYACLARKPVSGHVWSNEDPPPEYLPEHDSFDHPKDFSVRHLFNAYWPKEHKVAERLALAEPESESHVTSHIEEYHPVYVHKPFTRSLDSHLVASTVPALLLTVLTFPLTITLLVFILKQLVGIQTAFNQNLMNQMGSEGHGRVSADKVNNVAANFDKALNKYKLENE